MRVNGLLGTAACVGMLLVAGATAASAQNVLANAGFESPRIAAEIYGAGTGWTVFGNVYLEPASFGCMEPASGRQLLKMFGNFSGGFNVTGIFQEFPTLPGDVWTFSCKTRSRSCDPMIGHGAPDGNWVVQRIAFFDAHHAEIGWAAVESTVLNGDFPRDVWLSNPPISGTAPLGAVKMQALILFLQPGFDSGAAQVDDASLEVTHPVPAQATTWGKIKSLYR